MRAREVDMGKGRDKTCTSWDTHQGAPLGLRELGGHKVLYRSQQDDDSRANQGTDPQDVVEKDHAHDDLEKATEMDSLLQGCLARGHWHHPHHQFLRVGSFQMPWGWSRAQD